MRTPFITVTKQTANGLTTSTFSPQTTWTNRFFCFRNRSSTTPSRQEEAILTKAGLGLSKVKFPDKNADHDAVVNRLVKEFPLLKSQDGAI